MSIYDNVKAACKEKGVSISNLESDLKFARGSIYKWNNNTPGVDKVKAVADYFLRVGGDVDEERKVCIYPY